MNAYIKIIAASSLGFFFQNGWGMMSLHQKDQKRPSIGFCQHNTVLDRSFRKNQKMLDHFDPFRHCNSVELNTHQDVLYHFDKEPIQETTNRYVNLPEQEKSKTMDALSERKQFELMMGHEAVKVSILYELFNKNTNMALMCTKKPTSEVLSRYSEAQKLMEKYPIVCGDTRCGEQHYMILTDDEAKTLSTMFGQSIVYDRKHDIDRVINAFSKLQKIDPQFKKIPKKLTNSIRLYPSLGRRADLFGSAYGNRMLEHSLFYSFFGAYAQVGYLLYSYDSKYAVANSFLFNKEFVAGLGACMALQSFLKYPHYKSMLENNVLPVQSSLSDLLRERTQENK